MNKRSFISVSLLLIVLMSLGVVSSASADNSNAPRLWRYSAAAQSVCSGNATVEFTFSNNENRDMYVRVTDNFNQTQSDRVRAGRTKTFTFNSGGYVLNAGQVTASMYWNSSYSGDHETITRNYNALSCRPDKSSLQVTGQCVDDGALFTVLNTGEPGQGDMVLATAWRLVLVSDGSILDSGTLMLPGGGTFQYLYNGGQEVRFEADQQIGHPGNSHPNTVLNCVPVDYVCENIAPRTYTSVPDGYWMDDSQNCYQYVCYDELGNPYQSVPEGYLNENGICRPVVCTVDGNPVTSVPEGYLNENGICQPVVCLDETGAPLTSVPDHFWNDNGVCRPIDYICENLQPQTYTEVPQGFWMDQEQNCFQFACYDEQGVGLPTVPEGYFEDANNVCHPQACVLEDGTPLSTVPEGFMNVDGICKPIVCVDESGAPMHYVPDHWTKGEDGVCRPIDYVCENLSSQTYTEVPEGYWMDEETNCFAYACYDLQGNPYQEVPEGWTLGEDGVCRPPVDVCPNKEGVQTEIPAGMIVDNQGNCVTNSTPVPPTEVPQYEEEVGNCDVVGLEAYANQIVEVGWVDGTGGYYAIDRQFLVNGEGKLTIFDSMHGAFQVRQNGQLITTFNADDCQQVLGATPQPVPATGYGAPSTASDSSPLGLYALAVGVLALIGVAVIRYLVTR